MDWRHPDHDTLSMIHRGDILRILLDASAGQSIITAAQVSSSVNNLELITTLEELGLLQRLPDQQWHVSGKAKIRLAMRAIQLGASERHILNTLTWQEFEEFVAHIFILHDFIIHQRYRFSANRRYEIDLVSVRKPILFCVDCKHYGIRRGKTSALRSAVESQLERVETLATHFPTHQIKLNLLGWHEVSLIPMLVTMLHEDIIFHNSVPIVPASQLNAFLATYEEHRDQLRVLHPDPTRQRKLLDD